MIYLDEASTTRLQSEILQDYTSLLSEYFANPNSTHKLGKEVDNLHEKARAKILDLLGLKDYEVVFTSGATEANNLAIIGFALAHANRGNHLITTKIEHPSILEAFRYLDNTHHFKVTYLSVNKEGSVDLHELESAITSETILVSIMGVNNEIGSINDLMKISALIKKYPKITFHSDLVQMFSHEDMNFSTLDMFTVSMHKIGGLNGSGILVKRKSISLSPVIHGGGQEYGYRSGTQDALKDIMVSKTIRLALEKMKSDQDRIREMHDYLYNKLASNNDIVINSPKNGTNYIINFSLKKCKASVVVEALSNRGIMVSSLSACSSKKEKTSYVIKETTQDIKAASNSIRVSFNSDNNLEEIKEFVEVLFMVMKEIFPYEI